MNCPFQLKLWTVRLTTQYSFFYGGEGLCKTTHFLKQSSIFPDLSFWLFSLSLFRLLLDHLYNQRYIMDSCLARYKGRYFVQGYITKLSLSRRKYNFHLRQNRSENFLISQEVWSLWHMWRSSRYVFHTMWTFYQQPEIRQLAIIVIVSSFFWDFQPLK